MIVLQGAEYYWQQKGCWAKLGGYTPRQHRILCGFSHDPPKLSTKLSTGYPQVIHRYSPHIMRALWITHPNVIHRFGLCVACPPTVYTSGVDCYNRPRWPLTSATVLWYTVSNGSTIAHWLRSSAGRAMGACNRYSGWRHWTVPAMASLNCEISDGACPAGP